MVGLFIPSDYTLAIFIACFSKDINLLWPKTSLLVCGIQSPKVAFQSYILNNCIIITNGWAPRAVSALKVIYLRWPLQRCESQQLEKSCFNFQSLNKLQKHLLDVMCWFSATETKDLCSLLLTSFLQFCVLEFYIDFLLLCWQWW